MKRIKTLTGDEKHRSRTVLDRANNQTRRGVVGDWMKSKTGYNRNLTRLPTSIKASIDRGNWITKYLCCCFRRSDSTISEIQEALRGLNLSLYELEYLNMSTSFTEPEIVLLARQYHHLDLNRDGVVSSDELIQLPEFRRNPMKHRLKEYFQNENGSETFSIRQFIKTLSVFSPRSPIVEKVRFLFNVYDCDGDGMISREDLRKILTMTLSNKMEAEDIERVVEETFKECARSEANSFVPTKHQKVQDFITYKNFREVLANTDVGSKVSIDLERLARSKQLVKIGRSTTSFPNISDKKLEMKKMKKAEKREKESKQVEDLNNSKPSTPDEKDRQGEKEPNSSKRDRHRMKKQKTRRSKKKSLEKRGKGETKLSRIARNSSRSKF
eukprot:jgi/Bigna1/129428/aug1.9_g4136